MRNKLRSIEIRWQVFCFRCTYWTFVAAFAPEYRHNEDVSNFLEYLTNIYRESLNNKQSIPTINT